MRLIIIRRKKWNEKIKSAVYNVSSFFSFMSSSWKITRAFSMSDKVITRRGKKIDEEDKTSM